MIEADEHDDLDDPVVLKAVEEYLGSIANGVRPDRKTFLAERLRGEM